MMDFRQRLEQSRPKPVVNEQPAEPDNSPITCPYYATDRGGNPVCLELRFSTGMRKAFPYSYFTEIVYDNEAGIEIFTNNKRICIAGRCLLALFDALSNYRVRYIQANIGNDQPEDGLFVQGILVEDFTG